MPYRYAVHPYNCLRYRVRSFLLPQVRHSDPARCLCSVPRYGRPRYVRRSLLRSPSGDSDPKEHAPLRHRHRAHMTLWNCVWSEQNPLSAGHGQVLFPEGRRRLHGRRPEGAQVQGSGKHSALCREKILVTGLCFFRFQRLFMSYQTMIGYNV